MTECKYVHKLLKKCVLALLLRDIFGRGMQMESENWIKSLIIITINLHTNALNFCLENKLVT